MEILCSLPSQAASPLTHGPGQYRKEQVCGIAGVLGRVLGASSQETGRRIGRVLNHRGPDRSAVHLLPRNAGIFVHTRLRVIDLSEAADQPFLSDCGQIALVFNGEIYNHRDLRRDLQARGYNFLTSSDTEVILRLYEACGPSAWSELDGMFAFAVHDARSSKLYLMRDRAGKKPLVYAEPRPGEIFFASESKALAEVPDFHLEPDWSSLPELMAFGYVATPRSFIKGLRRVEPAHRIDWSPGSGSSTRRYWALPAPAEGLSLSVNEAACRVRETVSRAVKKRLVADVPMGALLSGGIDSSVIVAEMASSSPEPVRSFAAGFPDDTTFDETPAARKVASQLGLEHRELQVSLSPQALLSKLLWHHDEPYGDSSALALYGISELTRQHVTVVLTGDGGDELFGGYTRFLGAILLEWIPRHLLGLGRKLFGHLPEFAGYKHPATLFRRFAEFGERTPNEQLLAWNSFFAGPALKTLFLPEVVGECFDPWTVMAPQTQILNQAASLGADRLDQILRHNFQTYLLDDLLVKADRMTMAWGLEARSPFLDTELIELCFRLPSKFKVHGLSLKWILKKAYQDLLPPNVLHQPKHGFGVPVGRWWRAGEGREMVHDLLLVPGTRCHEVFSPRVLRSLVREHESKLRDHGQRLFLLLQLELWLRCRRGAGQQAG
ncbi:MAG: asparagine synthase (glutamine-hydrolyzing) [Myxococcota bacterium]